MLGKYKVLQLQEEHTRWKTLLQLLGLLQILKDESVQVLLASDLDLDGAGLSDILLNAGGYGVLC